MTRLYGIPHCDTVKKARKWLDSQGIAYQFHDYKKAGVDAEALVRWVSALGWEALLNKRGTTWRGLSDTVKDSVVDDATAVAVMQAHSSLIRRPVLEKDGQLLVGFSEAEYSGVLLADA